MTEVKSFTDQTVAALRNEVIEAEAEAINKACDDIKEEADIYAGPVDDALNLLVNVSLSYLRGEAESVGEAIVLNYEADLDCPDDDCEGSDCEHGETERDDRLVGTVLGWLNGN